MAERRMFHAGVVESDSFLDMTPAAQALYFHLGMQADDDGFVNGPRQVCRRCGAQIEQLQELLDGGFLLWFDGIAVVKHFRMANTLQNDRLKQLRYPEIAKQLYLSPNRIYTIEAGKRKENLYYIRAKQIREIKKRTGKLLESIRNPRVTEPNLTEPNLTEPNLTQPNRIIGSTEEKNETDSPTYDDDVRNETSPSGEEKCYDRLPTVLLEVERDGVVHLTNEEAYRFLTTVGYNKGKYYIKKLASFIKEKDADIKDHYATLMKWWQEDGGKIYD